MHGLTNDLTLYVHPRYTIFTVLFTCIALALLLFTSSHDKNSLSKSSLVLCVLIAVVAILLPARSLSERTAQLRSQTNITTNSNLVISSFDNFSQDYSHFKLQDWASFLSTSPDASQITSKKATIEGFIYEASGVRYIARFRLSCCAVDATPISIPLKKTEQTSQLTIGSWQRVEGVFVLENEVLVIEPTTLTEINEPEQPYVY